MRALVLLTVVACARPAEEYLCERSAQCLAGGAAGFCEPSGFCSFLDPGCQTGRRYGELAGGELAGACVALPRCGDGVVREEVEECDDADDDDEDGCTHACMACTADADARFAWAENGHCYTRHEVPTDWYGAREACYGQRAYLSSHESEAENAAVAAALGGAGPAWFGLENPTLWVSGQPVQYTRWATGCPGAGSSFSIDAAGEWCDREEPLPYLCEHGPAWAVRPDDGHAYRAIEEPVTWDVAASKCGALGAHLVEIEDSDEQVFVAALIGWYGWLGAHDREVVGTYVWSSGTPVGYANWGFDEPSGGPDERCVVMYADGTWRDVLCDDNYLPVCEREL